MKHHKLSVATFILSFLLAFYTISSSTDFTIAYFFVTCVFAAIPSIIVFLFELLYSKLIKKDKSSDIKETVINTFSPPSSIEPAKINNPVFIAEEKNTNEKVVQNTFEAISHYGTTSEIEWTDILLLPEFDIKTNGKKIKIQPTSFLKALTYSSITTKSNIHKLGRFVVIDIETTGLSMAKNDVIEIAAIKYDDFQPIEVFHTFTFPIHGLCEDAAEINNITEEMVAGAPLLYQIIPSLQEFISGYNLVAHNFEFDFKFLCRAGLDIVSEKRKYYDTLKIAQKLLKKPKYIYDKELEEYLPDYESDYDVENHKLDTLCDYYDISRNEGHRALSDCFDTARLFKAMAEEKIN